MARHFRLGTHERGRAGHAGLAPSARRRRCQGRSPDRCRVHADVPRHRLAVGRTIDDPTQAARAAAVLTLVGAINIPIIKFSVDWWNTLHQPASVLRLGGPTIHPAILVPLIVMAVAFTLLFVTLHLAAMRNEIMRRRVRTLMMLQAGIRAGPS